MNYYYGVKKGGVTMGKNKHNHGHNTMAFIMIFFGVILLLDRTGVISGIKELSFRNLWPLIFVIIGVNTLSTVKQNVMHYVFGLGFLFVGGSLLLRNFELIPYFRFNWSLIWPAFMILLGIKIFSDNHYKSRKEDTEENGEIEGKSKYTDNDYIDNSVFLGGSDFRYSSKNLQGGNLSAVLGGCKVILNDADFKGDTLVINVFAFWGGIEIYIPKNWQLNVKCTPIMGSIEHKIVSEENGVIKNKTLVIKGTVIMAGVEIKS